MVPSCWSICVFLAMIDLVLPFLGSVSTRLRAGEVPNIRFLMNFLSLMKLPFSPSMSDYRKMNLPLMLPWSNSFSMKKRILSRASSLALDLMVSSDWKSFGYWMEKKQCAAILSVRSIRGKPRMDHNRLFSILIQKYSSVSIIIVYILRFINRSTWIGFTPPKIDQQAKCRNTPMNLAFSSLLTMSKALSTSFCWKMRQLYFSISDFFFCGSTCYGFSRKELKMWLLLVFFSVLMGKMVEGNSWQYLSRKAVMSASLVLMGVCSSLSTLMDSLTCVKGKLKILASQMILESSLSSSRMLAPSFILQFILRLKFSLKGKMYFSLMLRISKSRISRFTSSFSAIFSFLSCSAGGAVLWQLISFLSFMGLRLSTCSISPETVWFSTFLESESSAVLVMMVMVSVCSPPLSLLSMISQFSSGFSLRILQMFFWVDSTPKFQRYLVAYSCSSILRKAGSLMLSFCVGRELLLSQARS